ncbi:MAG: hypothetical protein NC036_01985 [Muribaculaceae bacterium]|nr:hypothetical protein [Muribaculaceae bacterium]
MDTVRVVIYANPDDVFILNTYSKSKHYKVVKVFEVGVLVWYDIVKFIQLNNIQMVLVMNCTSISCKVYDFLSIVNDLCKIKVCVHIHTYKIDSLLPTGKVNPVFRTACKILYEFDTLDRNQSKERLEKGYSSHRRRGGRVGRKKGYRKSYDQYLIEYEKEIDLLIEGVSLKRIRDLTGTSISTLRKLKIIFV